jgi:hypothetical protein
VIIAWSLLILTPLPFSSFLRLCSRQSSKMLLLLTETAYMKSEKLDSGLNHFNVETATERQHITLNISREKLRVTPLSLTILSYIIL